MLPVSSPTAKDALWKEKHVERAKAKWGAAVDDTTLMEDAAVGGLKPLAHYENHSKPKDFEARHFVGLALACLGLLLAAGGGIGGGGILVPIYIIVMGFSPKVSHPGPGV